MSSGSLSLKSSERDASRLRLPSARTAVRGVAARPELLAVLAVAGVLNLWNLSRNAYANTFYAAAIKSMAASWHDFIFNSMDRAGLMTVDKPPLADWIQALSVRIFGFNSWALLAPQAAMGIIAAGLMYDLVRRRFGRLAAFVAGFTLATTPTIVAVSRHNNPDELLVMLSVAAVWFALRAYETGRTKWLVWSGAMVGLGFETKMGVALMLIPGLTLGWVWTQWRGREAVADGAGPAADGAGPAAVNGATAYARRTSAGSLGGAVVAVRRNLRPIVLPLIWSGLALAIIGLAWPILVTLTPAADRPWISGTSDNSIWSLITGYNGLGRVGGQSGGPGGTGGGFGGGGTSSVFGGGTGIFRLIGDSLGSQAGWLLGAAVVAALALVMLSRLRSRDPRTGFVLVVGVTLLIIGVVFSFAAGIFHPYYVSMVAPWVAALVGAGIGEALPRPFGSARSALAIRILGPALLIGGAITELVVLHEVGALKWAQPLVIVAAAAGAVALLLALSPRLRAAVLAVAVAALLAAPVTWASETLGYATSSTFPTGGPESAATGGFGGGPRNLGGAGGGFARRGGFAGGVPGSGTTGGLGPGTAARGAPAARSGSSSSTTSGAGVIPRLFGNGGSRSGATGRAGATGPTTGAGVPGGSSGAVPPGGIGGFSAGGGFGGFGGAGGSSAELDAAARYATRHGGGTVAVESQSEAAQAIVDGHENVAGIGGFSGLESSVTASWIAMEVREGHLRYILADGSSAGGFGAGAGSSPGGSGRTGSAAAIKIAEKVARRVTFKYDGETVTMYDLRGRAGALLAAAVRS
jgi:4-amino-4-deoxy-L-arabinose transferase-like glycosyltransferase